MLILLHNESGLGLRPPALFLVLQLAQFLLQFHHAQFPADEQFVRPLQLGIFGSQFGGVPRPKVDNRRTRSLTREEAVDLLQELAKRFKSLHDMALFPLYTGSRAGEVFSLQWSDVGLFQGTAMLKDTKSGRNLAVFLTDEVRAMLVHRRPSDVQANSLVFLGRDDAKILRISKSFERAVDELKFNEGVTDRRQRVTFHTLRHTFASWLAMDGINPFDLKELLGHSDLKLTERYSHLSESTLKQAALRIQYK